MRPCPGILAAASAECGLVYVDVGLMHPTLIEDPAIRWRQRSSGREGEREGGGGGVRGKEEG